MLPAAPPAYPASLVRHGSQTLPDGIPNESQSYRHRARVWDAAALELPGVRHAGARAIAKLRPARGIRQPAKTGEGSQAVSTTSIRAGRLGRDDGLADLGA